MPICPTGCTGAVGGDSWSLAGLIACVTMPTATDFLIIAPLPEEREAVLAELPGYEELPAHKDRTLVYYRASVPVQLSDGRPGSYSVVIFSPLGMSNLPAAVAVGEALQSFTPRYVLVVGIAGGVAGQAALGDVLIAEQVAGYEVQKLLPERLEIRWSVFRANPELLAAARDRLRADWSEGLRLKRPGRGQPRLLFGPIASGDKVIASNRVVACYQATWPKLLGVEMEAVGVASTLEQQRRGPGFLMIRGVSDLADENKNKTATKRWRPYACAIAARCAVALIKSGPVPLSPVRARKSARPRAPERSHEPSQESERSPSPALLAGMVGHGAAKRISNLLGHYLGAESAASPFGGRQQALSHLNDWLSDEVAPQRLLLCASAGIGKTALLCQWWRRELADRPGLQVAFFPISSRYDTRREADVMPALLARLAHIHKIQLPDQSRAGSGAWRLQLHELLRRPLPDGQRLLLILDGLDEAADWQPDRTLLPHDLPPAVRVAVSARPLAGDEGAIGWQRRLGFGHRDARLLPLGLLAIEETRDVAQQFGLPLRQDGESSAVVAALQELTGGDPLVLRLRVEDLVAKLPAGTLPDVEQLKRLPKGLSGYLEELCGPEFFADGPPTSAVSVLQSLVALANAPLLRADLRVLAPELETAEDWSRALVRLGRILIGDGTEQGFVYSHSRLRDYFEERLSATAARALRERFVRYTKDSVEALQAGRLRPADLSLYVLTCGAAHLAELDASVEEQLALVSEIWLRAWFAREQGYDGFLRDVERAREIAEAEFLRSRSEVALLGVIRCALCKQLVHDQSEHLYPALLRSLLAEGLWMPARALASIRHAKTHGTTSFRDLMAALIPFLSTELLWDGAALALERQNPYSDGGQALLVLAPRLAQAQPERAVGLADYAEQDWIRLCYLAALVPSLDGPLRESTAGWALRLVHKEPGSRRANELIDIAMALGTDDHRAESLFREAWEQGDTLAMKERLRLWRLQVSRLPPPLAASLLAASLEEILLHAELYEVAHIVGVVIEWDAALGRPLLNRVAAHQRARQGLFNWAGALHDVGVLGRPMPDPRQRWQKLRERLYPVGYKELRDELTGWILSSHQHSLSGLAILELVAGELSTQDRERLRKHYREVPSTRERAQGLCVLAPYDDPAHRLDALAAALRNQRRGEDLDILCHAIAGLNPDQGQAAQALFAHELAGEGPEDQRALYVRTFCCIYLSDHGGPDAEELVRQARALAKELSDKPSKAQALYALAVRCSGEAQAALLEEAAECADLVDDPQRRYKALRLIALGLNEPWREGVLRHALDSVQTWSQREQWAEFKLLLDHAGISDSLRSELCTRARSFVTLPSDGSMYWHDYLGIAELLTGEERRRAIQLAADAAQRVDAVAALISSLINLSPSAELLDRLLSGVMKQPPSPEQLRLLLKLYPHCPDSLKARINRQIDQNLATFQQSASEYLGPLAELMGVAPPSLQPRLCDSLYSMVRAFVRKHHSLLQTPKQWLPAEQTYLQDRRSGALRRAAQALTPQLEQAQIEELLSWLPLRAEWSDVRGALIARINQEDRRRDLFQQAWALLADRTDERAAMQLAFVAVSAPDDLRTAAIAEALQRARINRHPMGSSTDSRPVVLRYVAAHLSTEHVSAVLKHVRDILVENDGHSNFLNLPYLISQVPDAVRVPIAEALLADDSPLKKERQVLLCLALAATDPAYLPRTFQDIRPLLDPFTAGRLAELAPNLPDGHLHEALALLLSSPSINQTPASWIASLGSVAGECERRGWDVRAQLAQSTVQILRGETHNVSYLLMRLGDLCQSFAVLGVRTGAVADTAASVMEWFPAKE